MKEKVIATPLLRWFAQHGRHDLPWQQDPTAYRVWVSEIMLQQTQVATVIPYYEKFMASFANVSVLSEASTDKVLHHWSGLGYYARARNLHKTAQQVVNEHGGEFPASLDALVALPGIGRSTAGAIRSLAMGEREAILDGNVKRVLARYYAIEGWPGKTSVQKQLWEIAEAQTPQKKVAAYTQAIMDLGATVCTRSKPDCEACPLVANCAANVHGRQTDFPGRKPKKSVPQRSCTMLLCRRGKQVLLQRRPPAGIWGGLWGFPEIAATNKPEVAASELLGVEVLETEELPAIRHTFSHFQLNITPVQLSVGAEANSGSPGHGAAGVLEDSGATLWYDLEDPPEVGLAAPVAKLIKSLQVES